MDGVRSARVCVRCDCRSNQWNRGAHRSLRNDGIDAKPLAHLLDNGVAHLLLNMLLN